MIGLLLLACGGEPPEPCEVVDLHPDVDGDGYGDPNQARRGCAVPGWATAAGDCDDRDATRSPGAPEACDGEDDDCDGLADEEVSATRFLDRDGDGFGDPATEQETCGTSIAWVDQGGDCDDLHAISNPAAEEVCDLRDNDCDLEVDESARTAPRWHRDRDGDGFGDADSGRKGCTAPPGWLADGTDCDDERPEVNPAEPEICDGLDQDCDGLVDDDDPDKGAFPVWGHDDDGDGWGGTPEVRACTLPAVSAPAGDCDDGDPDRSPSAPERCNRIDDDCDGLVDDDDLQVPVDATPWYRDADGDGYGGEAGVLWTCDRPGGAWQRVGGDCDDTTPAVAPGATERCNGLDDDCDGLLDDADPGVEAADLVPYYADADGDGAGGFLMGLACAPPPGWAADGGDCDDRDPTRSVAVSWEHDADGDGFGDGQPTAPACVVPADGVAAGGELDCDDLDALVHPGGADVCGDAEDEDCDGVPRACPPPLVGTLDVDVVGIELWSDLPAEGAGGAVAPAGDLDGDGADDVLVGGRGTFQDPGRAWLVRGPLTTGRPLSVDHALPGEAAGDGAGTALAAGDLDGDGAPEVVVGAPFANPAPLLPTGVVYVVADPFAAASLADAQVRLTGDRGGDEAGRAVLLGDVDGDGLGDVAVGAPGADPAAADAGVLGIRLGPLRGGGPVGGSEMVLAGLGVSDRLGSTLAAAGDTDGDGVRELWVGATGAGPSDGGAVWRVEYANAYALAQALDGVVGERTGDALGTAIAGGVDLDGDGLDDLVAGAPGSDRSGRDAGTAYVFFGPVAGQVSAFDADALVVGEAPGDRAGAAVAASGSDVLVGSAVAGRAYVLRSPSGAASLASVDAILVGPPGEQLGAALSVAGAPDGDGRRDWLVGAPGARAGSGAAWLVFGP